MSEVYLVYWATAQVFAVFAPAIIFPCLINLAVDRQGAQQLSKAEQCDYNMTM